MSLGDRTLTGVLVEIDDRGGRQRFNTVAIYGDAPPDVSGRLVTELCRVILTGDRPTAAERDFAIGDRFDVTLRRRPDPRP